MSKTISLILLVIMTLVSSVGFSSVMPEGVKNLLIANPVASFVPIPEMRNFDFLPLLEKKLHLRSINTGEEIDVVFWKKGEYVEDGLAQLNYLLRDHRRGDVIAMDRELFMLVHRLYDDLNATGVIEVISGHRSQKTNDMLRSNGRKVAKKSQHVLGKAMDIRILSVPLKKLRDMAISYGVGGVGYYSKSQFVHVDTGKPRRW